MFIQGDVSKLLFNGDFENINDEEIENDNEEQEEEKDEDKKSKKSNYILQSLTANLKKDQIEQKDSYL